MASMLWRLLFAAIAVVLIYALIPPFARLLGLAIDADLLTIIRICVAGIAIFYVLRGPELPWLRQ